MRFRRPVPLQTRPTVSVVVPCYNYGHFLPDAVASALDQQGVDVEVLIVDDASTDDSAEVALRLARSDSRVDVLLHEANRGHIQTYNDGLAKVAGDYVVLLSADDVVTTNSLTRSAALLEAEPQVGLVYGLTETFDDWPPRPRSNVASSWSIWAGDAWVRRLCTRARNIIVNPEVVMRRTLLEELGGGYDPALPHSADMLLWMRAASRADIGRINGPVQAGYRDHGLNMHSTTFSGALTDLEHVRRTFDVYFAERPDQPLEETASRALARETLRAATLQQIHGVDAEDADRLASFAETCVPGVTRSWHWHGYHRRAARGTRRAEVAAIGALDSLRWRIRSQRLRRWGI